MYEQTEAEKTYRTLVRNFSDRNYPLFEKEFLAFKNSPLFDELYSDLQFDLEHYLLVSWYSSKLYTKCLEGIKQIKTSYPQESRRESSQIRLMILEAEILMKLERYEEGQALFESTSDLVTDQYSLDDLEYRWGLALDEIEVKQRKPVFLKEIRARWERLKETLAAF
jgi:hypothetical protein